ncbi:MAG: hypothetical protein QGF03_10900 [SAR324 cluster bacterium]|nr:hypothetical protein [SAR324 cluster bacterium]MDP7317778.1 hypothetical protein [SAR324 cluster bacterium]MDP7631061.1 hypothetical protein [SAR324 cluster bacterium]
MVHKEKERVAEQEKLAKQGILAQNPDKLELSGGFDSAATTTNCPPPCTLSRPSPSPSPQARTRALV